jgi:hypothetical protein
MTRMYHLPPMERTREGPTVSIWSNCPGCAVIMVLIKEWEAAIILPWRQWAQTRLLSNLSRDNHRSRLKPLSWHNKSKLRWPNLLCHFQNLEEDWESKYLKEDWAREKLAWKTFPMREMPHTCLSEESRTWESDLQKSTLKSASTSWETKSRLYLNLSTRATSFKVKKSFTLMTPVLSTLPFLSPLKVTLLVWQGSEAREPFLITSHVSWATRVHEPLVLRPLSNTYIGQEEVDGSVLGLVR